MMLNNVLEVYDPNPEDLKPKEKNLAPDLVQNQFVIAKPNVHWDVDCTHVDIGITNQPNTYHSVFIGTDPATNSIVFAKAFLTRSKSGTPTADACLKVLSHALVARNITDDLIIHTDRGGQFLSDLWASKLDHHPLVERSMTKGGAPQENAVSEKMNSTLKGRLFKKLIKNHSTVPSTRQLNRNIDRCVADVNLNISQDKLRGASAAEAEIRLELTDYKPPTKLMTQKYQFRIMPVDEKRINNYVEDAISDPNIELTEKQIKEYYPAKVVYGMYSKQIEQGETLDQVKDVVTEIHAQVVKKKKVKRKGTPKRDALAKNLFEEILESDSFKPFGMIYVYSGKLLYGHSVSQI